MGSRRRKIAEATYKIAARMVSDRSPNQREDDSSSPPSSEPNRFDPRALPRKLARAKLEIKIMPAKNTGMQRASVDTTARSAHDSKKSFCMGTANMPAKERNNRA